MSAIPYIIRQFEDKFLSHFAYAIISGQQMILIDPARNPAPYYEYAAQQQVVIAGVIETHLHADFVSSHLEIHTHTGAPIYTSRITGAAYPHQTFDNGDVIYIGTVKLKALNTPGHSPDSICIVLESEGADRVVFTGDTLLAGDCGCPGLREWADTESADREGPAKKIYASLRTKLLPLHPEVLIFPAHGAGSLYGKDRNDVSSSTLAEEKEHNWCLQDMTEAAFAAEMMRRQSLIPRYFEYNVMLNMQGAVPFENSIMEAERKYIPEAVFQPEQLEESVLIIDARPAKTFRKGHLPNSYNLPFHGKFETWLGSILVPGEAFYLNADTEPERKELIKRIAKIGFEGQIKNSFSGISGPLTEEKLAINKFRKYTSSYTIVDIRNPDETENKPLFRHSISIPLAHLKYRLAEIPRTKPIVVHCAGGYRSAAGCSILKTRIQEIQVFDLGEAVTEFYPGK